MDLQSETSIPESVEANGVIEDKLEQVNEHQTENNGPFEDEVSKDGVKDKEGVKISDQPSPLAVNVQDALITPPAKAKGFGLKRWKRIKREVNKDGSYSSETGTGRTMRGGSSALADKPTGLSADMPLKSDGSLASSTNADMRNDGFNAGIAFNSGSAIGPSFATETDSDNSEDYSSKSSTAASFPKMSRKTSSWVGYQPDRNRVKNQTDITVVKDPFQRGSSQKEASKKARGERIKIEEENSRSSMESDSRSSNVLFSHGSNSITSNGRRFNSKSTNYDEEILDEILDGEPKINNKHRDDFVKDNGNSVDALQDDLAPAFAWTSKTETDNCISSTANDPLVESILALKFAQEMLEKELAELKEVEISLGKEPTQSSSLLSELMGEKSFDPLDSQAISLKQELGKLKVKLDESAALLKQKEDKVFELEETLKLDGSTIDDMQDILKGQQKRENEMEEEIASLFKQKIETEIQFIVVSRAIQTIDNELALDKEEMMHEGVVEKVETGEDEALKLENKAYQGEDEAALKLENKAYQGEDEAALKLENKAYQGEDEALKLENKAYQVGLYTLIQLMLFFVVFALFFSRLSSYYSGIVPT